MERNWFYYPSKKTVVLFNLIWLLGALLLFMAMSDLFSVNPLQGKYFMLFFLLGGSTSMTLWLNINYNRNRKAG